MKNIAYEQDYDYELKTYNAGSNFKTFGQLFYLEFYSLHFLIKKLIASLPAILSVLKKVSSQSKDPIAPDIHALSLNEASKL